jgi:hypothetical protein
LRGGERERESLKRPGRTRELTGEIMENYKEGKVFLNLQSELEPYKVVEHLREGKRTGSCKPENRSLSRILCDNITQPD